MRSFRALSHQTSPSSAPARSSPAPMPDRYQSVMDDSTSWPAPPKYDAPHIASPGGSPSTAQTKAPSNRQRSPARATVTTTMAPAMTADTTTTIPTASNSATVPLVAAAAAAQAPAITALPPTTSSGHPAPTKMEKRTSRMSLFNLFSRPKVEKQRGHHERGLPPLPDEGEPVETTSKELPRTPEAGARPRTSRLSSTTPPATAPPATKPSRQVPSWEPLSLSQVSAHSIRLAKIQVPAMSARYIIRAQNAMRQSVVYDTGDAQIDGGASAASAKKLEKTRAKSTKQLSASLSKLELTWKTFVLLSSGHLLQYSVEGSSDRLPEKILQLGTESAAFACDLIPGKHWVLQVSQKADEEGAVEEVQSQSFLSRLRSQNSVARRMCSIFLLVLDSAESMDEWLTSVRKEIEVLGGMKLRPALGPPSKKQPTIDESVEETEEQISASSDHSRQSSSTKSPVDSGIASAEFPRISTYDSNGVNEKAIVSVSDIPAPERLRRDSTRPSSDAPSIATTVMSQDQLQLNQLRESSRLSYISTGTGSMTAATSRSSTPNPPSPRRESLPKSVEQEQAQQRPALRPGQRLKTPGPNPWRQSLQSIPSPRDNTFQEMAALTPAKVQRHSIYGSSFRSPQHSPPRPLLAAQQGRHLADSFPEESPLQPLEPLQPPSRSMSEPAAGSVAQSQTVPHQLRLPLETSASLSGPGRARHQTRPIPRQLPVRSDPNIPRRNSSLPARPPPLPAPLTMARPSTAQPPPQQHRQSRQQMMQEGRETSQQLQSQQQSQKSSPPLLRRPISMQIRADHAPFLSSSRFSTANNRSMTALVPPRPESQELNTRPKTGGGPAPRQRSPAPNQRLNKHRSVPAITLLPPAPPPNMPLPAPPPSVVPVVAM